MGERAYSYINTFVEIAYNAASELFAKGKKLGIVHWIFSGRYRIFSSFYRGIPKEKIRRFRGENLDTSLSAVTSAGPKFGVPDSRTGTPGLARPTVTPQSQPC